MEKQLSTVPIWSPTQRNRIVWGTRSVPQGLKPVSRCTVSGTAEPVPFPMFVQQLPLAELEAFTRTLLAVLLAFLHAAIASEKASGLQLGAQLRAELQQRAGNAHLHRASLGGDATAVDLGDHIKSARDFGSLERTARIDALGVGDEVHVKRLVVDLEVAIAG